MLADPTCQYLSQLSFSSCSCPSSIGREGGRAPPALGSASLGREGSAAGYGGGDLANDGGAALAGGARSSHADLRRRRAALTELMTSGAAGFVGEGGPMVVAGKGEGQPGQGRSRGRRN